MLEKTWCVYKHTNKTNGKVYIGITSDKPEKRWARGLKYKQNAHFTNAIEKYGWDGFSHDILCTGLTQKEASAKEIEYIAFYKSSDRRFGYNKALGGCGRESVSEETRQKMSESHIGEKNHNYGKPKSDETKQRLSESQKKYWAEHPRQKGWHHTAEARAKMSAKLKGRKCPLEGKHHTIETVKKIAEKNSKAVFCVETGVIYPNARIAATEVGTQYSSISCVCNNKGGRVLAGGYRWRFATPEDYTKNNDEIINVAPRDPSYFKKVRCVETGEIYRSIAEAARQVNRAKNTVCGACKNSRKTAGGYHWEYV